MSYASPDPAEEKAPEPAEPQNAPLPDQGSRDSDHVEEEEPPGDQG